jgi:tetratricopeptide (TPR) repeat protein
MALAPGASQAAAQARPTPPDPLERAAFERGDLEQGGEALAAALPTLAPARATEVIQLLADLERVGPDAAQALTTAAAANHRGQAEEARAALDSALVQVPREDREPVLVRAAGLALAQGDSAAATTHLRALVEDHGDGPYGPEALLALARLRAAAPDGLDEARALLTRLIVERPQAAVVPAARRELERLGRGGRP